MSSTPEPARPTVIDWAAGAGLGLLLGLLVGLSSSPVVSSVVVGLVALLAGMLGLSDKLPGGLSRAGAHRLTAFALAASAAVLAGLHLRSHDLLAPDVATLRGQLAEIGITDLAEQRQMLRYLRFGLVPDGSKGDGSKRVEARATLLYGESADLCGSLRRQLSEGAAWADVALLLRTGSDAAHNVAERLAGLSESERAAALRVAPLYLCAR